MGMMITILALAILLSGASMIYFRRYRFFPERLSLLIPATKRSLSSEEKQAAVAYLSAVSSSRHPFLALFNRSNVSKEPVFTLRSHKVYSLNYPITRYGLSTSSPSNGDIISIPLKSICHRCGNNSLLLKIPLN